MTNRLVPIWFSLREAAKEGAQEWEIAGAGVAAMQVLSSGSLEFYFDQFTIITTSLVTEMESPTDILGKAHESN